MNVEPTVEGITKLRRLLETAFRPDTASPGFPAGPPSSGHCAAVTAIVHELLGGQMISTRIGGYSHWLNRLQLDGREVDVDLTGDQFGSPPVQINTAGEVYPDTRVRSREELNDETLERARILAGRIRLVAAVRALNEELRRRKVLDRA